MYKPLEMLKVGFCARSAFPVDLDGKMKIDAERYQSRVVFDLPPIFTLGVGYKPLDKVTLGLDISYMMYGDMDEIRFKTTGLPTEHNRTYYKDAWEFKIGGDYQATERLAVRAGFFFTEGATKLKGLTPASNDIDLLIPSVGLAYRLTDAFEFTLGMSYNGGLEREYAGQRFDVDHWNVVSGMRLDFWAPTSGNSS